MSEWKLHGTDHIYKRTITAPQATAGVAQWRAPGGLFTNYVATHR